jgi:outer membrane murein-binding lipoprotein Lpp
MKVRCKELEFECESLRECLREYQGREVTGDQWRMNKLKESHEKVNELSQQVETMTMEMQAVRAEKGRLEGELGRAKEELAKMHAVVQEKQNLVSRQEVGHKEAI